MAGPPVFTCVRPPGLAGPVVFDSPHSGMEWPPDFDPIATRSQILTTWDAFVDELFAGVRDAGAVLLAARFPRAYLDANRAADDIDLELVDGDWPGPVRPTDYTRRGMGLIRRYVLPGVPMYGRRLSVAEVEHRLDAYYRPYRSQLLALLDETTAAHDVICHVNCHSMKSRGNAMNVDAGAPRPDVVVSDRQGTTADPALTAFVAAFLRERAYDVRINDPYQGGDLVRSTGDPGRGRHSLQLEINRAVYMNEATYERHARFAVLQRDLADLAAALAARVKR
jgi:N-formylglutamate deformylase